MAHSKHNFGVLSCNIKGLAWNCTRPKFKPLRLANRPKITVHQFIPLIFSCKLYSRSLYFSQRNHKTQICFIIIFSSSHSQTLSSWINTFQCILDIHEIYICTAVSKSLRSKIWDFFFMLFKQEMYKKL